MADFGPVELRSTAVLLCCCASSPEKLVTNVLLLCRMSTFPLPFYELKQYLHRIDRILNNYCFIN